MGDCDDLNHLSNKDIIIISNIKIKITKNYKFFLKSSKNYLCVLFRNLFPYYLKIWYYIFLYTTSLFFYIFDNFFNSSLLNNLGYFPSKIKFHLFHRWFFVSTVNLTISLISSDVTLYFIRFSFLYCFNHF